MITPVGLDMGNTDTKICIEGLVAKLPSRYAYECPPGQINASGQQGKPQAFQLLFTRKEETFKLWFGRDTLATPAIQKLDVLKYDPAHIQILLKAALYQWELTHRSRHKVDLANLGKLNIVASMPPGMFEDRKMYNKALTAYKDAFNKNVYSHPKIRDGKRTVQIVCRFAGLQPEAVAWGQSVPRKNEWILTVDLGGGTDDYALFNGSDKPLKTITSPTGLLHVYQQINRVDPAAAELDILRNKKRPPALLTYFSEVERRIQLFIRQLPVPISRLYIIGGGAVLMPQSTRNNIKTLVPKVYFKDEYANCRANYLKAGGGK